MNITMLIVGIAFVVIGAALADGAGEQSQFARRPPLAPVIFGAAGAIALILSALIHIS